MPPRLITSSRRAAKVNNKTKLVIVTGSNKFDDSAAEIILWDNDAGGNASSSDVNKSSHVGAIGVDSSEVLEHHLQAALSSASLLHSRPATKPSSPTPSSSRHKPEQGSSASASAAASASTSTLNYHIPTPDATGLVSEVDFAALYQTTKYSEPVNYVKFSDTVEESSGGLGGLGYCMDDEDETWLTGFNTKAEGSGAVAGTGLSGVETASSPLRETTSQNQPLSSGRERRDRSKIKEKDKDKDKDRDSQVALTISEDLFEYVMGVMEKYAEDSVPMLHTNLSLLPQFSAIEPLFASPVPASFYPSNEVPKSLPDSKILIRIAKTIYPHWKQRREVRKGRTIFPILNYDETNDADPYVCFRRRDIRATRKTRRTDNFSGERMQKIQYELRSAHIIAQIVLSREQQKRVTHKVDKELWEARWKLFETKRRWPSLGLSPLEEEFITGRSLQQAQAAALSARQEQQAALHVNGAAALQAQSVNVPRISKKQVEREKEERERREREARHAEKYIQLGKSMAPEALKERMAALRQKLEAVMSERKAADVDWEDHTDSSYQPMPPALSDRSFRSITSLVPSSLNLGKVDEDGPPLLPASFRTRRGRNGVLRLDRRTAVFAHSRGLRPQNASDYSDWLFPDRSFGMPTSNRPKSIEQSEDEPESLPTAASAVAGTATDAADEIHTAKRPRSIDDAEGPSSATESAENSPSKRIQLRDPTQKINEVWRYHRGGLGVGMGVQRDTDRIIVDDQDDRYIKHRVTLLQPEDFAKLRPNDSVLARAAADLDAPIDLPPLPTFVRPELPNNQVMAQLQAQQQAINADHAIRIQAAVQHQQQLAHQQQQQIQYEQQQQQLNMLRQQAAASAAAVNAQAQAQAQGQAHGGQIVGNPGGIPIQMPIQIPNQAHGRIASDSSTNGSNGSPAVNNTQMLPPNGLGVQGQNGRPPFIKRPSSQNNNGHGPMAPPNQPRQSVSPTNSLHSQGQIPLPNPSQVQAQTMAAVAAMNNAPQIINGHLMHNGKPVLQQNGQPLDAATSQRYIQMARTAQQHAQAQLQNAVQAQSQGQGHGGLLPNGMDLAQLAQMNAAAAIHNNGDPNGNGNGNGNVNGTHGFTPTPEQLEFARLAQAGGFAPNLNMLDAKTKMSLMKMAKAQVQQQGNQQNLLQQQILQQQQAAAAAQAQVQAQAQAPNGNGNGAGNTNGTPQGQAGFQSPQIANAQMQLKLPPHAAARLGAAQSQTHAAQRA